MTHPTFRLKINGKERLLQADPDTPLLWALRDDLAMTGTRFGCGAGLCGACTVHLDGQATRACITPLSSIGEAALTTIEGLGAVTIGKVLQDAWLAEDVAQCGYCQAGQLMSAATLLAQSPDPTDGDIDAAMTGNICRCGTYPRIRKAIRRAALALKVSS